MYVQNYIEAKHNNVHEGAICVYEVYEVTLIDSKRFFFQYIHLDYELYALISLNNYENFSVL